MLCPGRYNLLVNRGRTSRLVPVKTAKPGLPFLRGDQDFGAVWPVDMPRLQVFELKLNRSALVPPGHRQVGALTRWQIRPNGDFAAKHSSRHRPTSNGVRWSRCTP